MPISYFETPASWQLCLVFEQHLLIKAQTPNLPTSPTSYCPEIHQFSLWWCSLVPEQGPLRLCCLCGSRLGGPTTGPVIQHSLDTRHLKTCSDQNASSGHPVAPGPPPATWLLKCSRAQWVAIWSSFNRSRAARLREAHEGQRRGRVERQKMVNRQLSPARLLSLRNKSKRCLLGAYPSEWKRFHMHPLNTLNSTPPPWGTCREFAVRRAIWVQASDWMLPQSERFPGRPQALKASTNNIKKLHLSLSGRMETWCSAPSTQVPAVCPCTCHYVMTSGQNGALTRSMRLLKLTVSSAFTENVTWITSYISVWLMVFQN